MSARAVPDTDRGSLSGLPARVRGRRWPWVAGYAIAAVALFFCYLRLSGTQKVTSDGATIALQGWAMLHGNLLLHGWTLTDVSFWTTELPEYMLIEAVRGLGAFDVHTAAAVTYTLLVLLAGLVAKGRATGREGLARVLIASGIMIAPQLGQGTLILLLAPDHTGTGVPLLVTWLILDRGGRRWWVPPAVGLLVAWTLAGDRVAEVLAVLPLLLVYGYRAVRGLVRRARRDGEPGREVWFDAAMAGAAVGGYVVSVLVVRLVAALHGFALPPVKVVPAPFDVIGGNIAKAADGISALFGAEFTGQPFGVQTVLSLAHLAGLGLVIVAVAIGIWRFPKSADPLVSVLTAGLLINVAVYTFSTMPVTIWSTREIAGVLPAGAVLAGRLLASRFATGGSRELGSPADRPAPRGAPRARLAGRLLWPAAGVVAALYIASVGYGMAQPQLPAEGQNLADWLTAHQLTNGLSGYGYGPTTTLASGGRADVRQADFSSGRVLPGPEEYNLSWYDPAQHDATFLVLAPHAPKFDPLTPSRARAIFGRPARIDHVSPEFDVWTYSTNLLTRAR